MTAPVTHSPERHSLVVVYPLEADTSPLSPFLCAICELVCGWMLEPQSDSKLANNHQIQPSGTYQGFTQDLQMNSSFEVPESWSLPKCPSVGEWLNNFLSGWFSCCSNSKAENAK